LYQRFVPTIYNFTALFQMNVWNVPYIPRTGQLNTCYARQATALMAFWYTQVGRPHVTTDHIIGCTNRTRHGGNPQDAFLPQCTTDAWNTHAMHWPTNTDLTWMISKGPAIVGISGHALLLLGYREGWVVRDDAKYILPNTTRFEYALVATLLE
jgi:hypothetical protein